MERRWAVGQSRRHRRAPVVFSLIHHTAQRGAPAASTDRRVKATHRTKRRKETIVNDYLYIYMIALLCVPAVARFPYLVRYRTVLKTKSYLGSRSLEKYWPDLPESYQIQAFPRTFREQDETQDDPLSYQNGRPFTWPHL